MTTIAKTELDGREEILRAEIVEAGRLALDWFERRSSLAVALKGPQDYASEADAAVERLLSEPTRRGLPRRCLPRRGGGRRGRRARSGWSIPIDGTANFVRGVPRFCVSVAFVADGKIAARCHLQPGDR